MLAQALPSAVATVTYTYAFSAYSVPTLVAMSAILLLGIFVLGRERVSGVSVSFFLVILAVSIWLFGYSWIYSSADASTALLWSKLAFTGIAFIGPATYTFSVVALGKYEQYRLVAWGAWALAVLFYVVDLFSGSIVTDVSRHWWSYYPNYGAVGALFAVYLTALLVASLAQFWLQYNRSRSDRARKRALWFTLAFGIGSIGLVDFLPAFGVGVYPFGYVPILFFTGLAARAIWTYRLVDITPALAAQQIMDTVSDALLVMDREGVVRVANRAASELFDVRKRELLGKPVAEALGADLEGLPARIDELLRSNRIRDYEMPYRLKSGELRILSLSASVMRERDAEPVAVVCVVRDVTERKLSEEHVSRQNEYLSALHDTSLGLMKRLDVNDLLEAIIVRAASLVGTSHGYIYVFDPDSRDLVVRAGTGIFLQNIGFHLKKGEGLAGWVWESGQPMKVDDYSAWAGRSRNLDFMNIHAVVGVPLTSGSSVAGVLGLGYMEQERTFGQEEIDSLMKFGELASIALDNARLYNEAQQELAERKKAEATIRKLNESLERRVAERTTQLQKLNLDLEKEVAERKRTEGELERVLGLEQAARAQAEDAVRERDLLLSIVSHDLKNPLSAIMGTAKLLQRATTTNLLEPQRLESGILRIREAADKMEGLIDELLDFAQLQAGSPLELNREPTDLVALVQGVCSSHQQDTTRHVIEVRSFVPSLLGSWDQARLERALDNLIANAVKYSPAGGQITVEIKQSGECALHGASVAGAAPSSSDGPEAGFAVLVVRDEGIGIPDADLPHIFEWFRRAQNVTGKIGGTGIGLASVRQTVEQHGGTIAVASREGEGTTFTICLPIEPAEE